MEQNELLKQNIYIIVNSLDINTLKLIIKELDDKILKLNESFISCEDERKLFVLQGKVISLKEFKTQLVNFINLKNNNSN